MSSMNDAFYSMYIKNPILYAFCCYHLFVNIGLIGHCIPKTMPSVKTAKSNACPSNCLNGGTCIGNASNYTCVCLKNYTGAIFLYFVVAIYSDYLL